MGTWEPVPSLNGKYELNNRGQLRNAKTKRKLKIQRQCGYHVSANGVETYVGIGDLLWEVFGIAPSKACGRPVPIVVSNGYTRRHFDTATDAAKFLAPRTKLTKQSIKEYISWRRRYIGVWHITYMNEPMPSSGLPKCRKK